MIVRRFISAILAAMLICAAPAQALTPAQRVPVLLSVQSWSLPGSSVDMYFARNAGSCTVARILKPCTSLLSVTRAQTVSSYARWADGHFSAFAANTLRNTDLGLLIEQAATNKQLWSNDWTNAAYVKVNVTAAMDQTGPDNVANSATSLTATADAATILQTVTEAATSNTASVYIKRITGSGAITLVQNGATGTTCTTSTTVWTICTVTATVLNPAIGIIMATNGDKIAVWAGQFETGAFSTSPIPTTTVAVARNADVITLQGASLTAALNANAAFFITNSVPAGAPSPRLLDFFSGSGGSLLYSSTTVAEIFNASLASANATLGSSGTTANLTKTSFGFDNSSMTAIANGGTLGSTANAWSPGTGPVYLGDNVSGIRALNGYLLRASLGPTKGMFDAFAVAP